MRGCARGKKLNDTFINKSQWQHTWAHYARESLKGVFLSLRFLTHPEISTDVLNRKRVKARESRRSYTLRAEPRRGVARQSEARRGETKRGEAKGWLVTVEEDREQRERERREGEGDATHIQKATCKVIY